MKLNTSVHLVFLFHYHLILVVKYRQQAFTDAISKCAKEIFSYIAPSYKIELVEWNHDRDHVHTIFSEAQLMLSKNISKIKDKRNDN